MFSFPGRVSIRRGALLTAVSSVHVIPLGCSGHGSASQTAADPIAAMAFALVRLEALVSREADPQQPALLTCDRNRGVAAAANVIPDHRDLHLKLRAFDAPSTRRRTRHCSTASAASSAPSARLRGSRGRPTSR